MGTANGLVERLDWDSDFFGVPIGRANLAGATEASLEAIGREAAELGLRCLYGALDGTEAQLAYLVQQHGFCLVDVAVVYDRKPGPFPTPPSDSTVRLGTPDDLPFLADAIAELAPWSRFSVDPRFGREAARRMHEVWVARAAEPGGDWQLLVAEDGDGITGFATMLPSEPRIDLIATTKAGSAASWALVADGIRRCGGEMRGGPIPARNVAPHRFVQSCGFRIAETRYLFHRWLDEPASAGEGGRG